MKIIAAFTTSLALATSVCGFVAPRPVPSTAKTTTTVSASSLSVEEIPFFVTVVEKEPVKTLVTAQTSSTTTTTTTKSTIAKKKKVVAKNNHKEGILTPVVKLARVVVGDEELNKIRGKVIGLHSDIISGFVGTSTSPFGKRVLKVLFELADKDKNGTICQDELGIALRALGFDLSDKQIKGIFDRADVNADGSISFEEWEAQAPSTLRTNLVKLAKKNGGDLGLLA